MEYILRKDSKRLCKELLEDKLLNLGYAANSISKKGNQAQEILVKTNSGDKIIQVRTNKYSKADWVLHKKVEELSEVNYLYVFVNLNNGNGEPSFYIVPSEDVANHCRKTHAEYIKKPGKHGQKHFDSTMRKFYDPEGKYLNAWQLLNM